MSGVNNPPAKQNILVAATGVATVGASATTYFSPGNNGTGAAELARQMVSPVAGTIGNLFVSAGGTQPASGSLVFTLRVNGADTPVTATLTAGAGASVVSDTTNAVAVAAGDLISIAAANAATATSATVAAMSFTLLQ